MRSAPLLIALAATLLHCASLEPIPASTCGNGVLDEREDCDASFVAASAACGAPTEGAKSCRFTCERLDAAKKCPAGWGCGVDGICRAGTGEIAAASEAFSGAAFTLIKGDFDGDGRADLIGGPPFGSEGGARVHYFDADSKLATLTPIDLPLVLPVVFDVDHDGADDITFALTGGAAGIAGLRGVRDRTFSALLSPAITFDNALVRAQDTGAALLPEGNGCVLAFVEDGDPQHPRRIRSICETDFLGLPFGSYYLPVPDVRPTDLVGGSPSRGKVLPSTGVLGDSGCGELVAAVNRGSNADEGHLLIASPCIVGQGGELAWASSLPMPGAGVATYLPLRDVPVPGTIDEAPIVADLDGDGVAEVLVHSRGRGYFAFRYEKASGVFVRANVPIGDGVEGRRERILAIADFDGNGAPDAVLNTGLVMNDQRLLGNAPKPAQGGNEPVAGPRNQQRWVEAVIGRFNADDRDDVLVRYEDSFDVELFMNVGDGRFTEYVVRSDQPVRAMAHRDLDGDGIEDVAFLESAAPLGKDSESKLVVAFGKPTGAPEPGRTVGTFQRARTLLGFAGSTGGGLVVAETDRVDAPSRTVVTTLYGTSGRQVVSPLFLSDRQAIRPLVPEPNEVALRAWRPIALTVGSLTKDSSDVLAISVAFTFTSQGLEPDALTSVWSTSYDSSARFSSFVEVEPLTSVVAAVDLERLREDQTVVTSAVAKLADLDLPDLAPPLGGLDEVVAIIRSPEGETGVLVVDQDPAVSGGLPALLFKLPNTSVSGGDPFDLADLDGDGRRDIVSILTVGEQRTLIVLRNDGNRKFLPTPVQLKLPTDEPPVAFAALATNAGPALVVVTQRRLFLVKLDAAKSGFEVTDRTSLLGTGPLRLTGVAAGDFDGNGVEDIAVADGGTIRILRQGARNP